MAKLHLTHAQMLERWRLLHGFLPLQPGLVYPRSDGGLDLDTLLQSRIEAWYRNLLLTAPQHLLAPAELAPQTSLPPASEHGGVTFQLPDSALRLLGVRLMGWLCDAEIVESGSPRARLQLHPYTRATAVAPVAVCSPGGFVTLYPAGTGENVLESLRVAGHADELYHFDEAALPEGVSGT